MCCVHSISTTCQWDCVSDFGDEGMTSVIVRPNYFVECKIKNTFKRFSNRTQIRMPMDYFTSENYRPKEQTILFIKHFARAYRVAKLADGSVVPLCMN